MDRILVIGQSGLVGSRVAKQAEGRYEVHGTYLTHELKGKNLHRIDSTDREAVVRLVERVKPDLVVDTHSLNNVDHCEVHHEEAWKNNVEGARNVAEACKKFSCMYEFLSTEYVFDGRKLRYTEKDKPRPLSYFAMTKVVVEQMLDAFDLNYAVARPAVIYGVGGLNKVSFALWLVDKLRKGERVTIVNDQKSNPTWADNLADQLLGLYEKGATGIFHVAGKDCLSRFDFSLEVARIFGLDESLISPVTTPQLHQIAPRPPSVNLSTAKVERVTNIPTLTVRDGLERLRAQTMS
jgi:dTDP-4-dehydrorhamnose reductase